MEAAPVAAVYEFRVGGVLGPVMLSAFPALQGAADDGSTVLRGSLPDQAALHGVLGQIEALGLVLLAVRRVA